MENFNLIYGPRLDNLILLFHLYILPIILIDPILHIDLFLNIYAQSVLADGFEQVSVFIEVLLIFCKRYLKVWNVTNLMCCHDTKDPFFFELVLLNFLVFFFGYSSDLFVDKSEFLTHQRYHGFHISFNHFGFVLVLLK